jgi:hypothetical protein
MVLMPVMLAITHTHLIVQSFSHSGTRCNEGKYGNGDNSSMPWHHRKPAKIPVQYSIYHADKDLASDKGTLQSFGRTNVCW